MQLPDLHTAHNAAFMLLVLPSIQHNCDQACTEHLKQAHSEHLVAIEGRPNLAGVQGTDSRVLSLCGLGPKLCNGSHSRLWTKTSLMQPCSHVKAHHTAPDLASHVYEEVYKHDFCPVQSCSAVRNMKCHNNNTSMASARLCSMKQWP